MNSNVEERRRQTLDLLAKTRRETRSALSRLDPKRVVHTDERAWCVRDVLGHLGVWNGEAARPRRSRTQPIELISARFSERRLWPRLAQARGFGPPAATCSPPPAESRNPKTVTDGTCTPARETVRFRSDLYRGQTAVSRAREG